ncbi:MAG: FGGY-family carbohydrate kinase, partial [bacterium]|nr:FGGY-family carbohydrate kinase [bacterium]
HGQTRSVEGLPNGIPIAGLAGDQQASFFGQSCFEAGEANCHYGDSVCLMINTGRKTVPSKDGLITTVAWKIKEETAYALEGSSFVAAGAIQWLQDRLKIIENFSEIEDLAYQVPDSGGVTFVPAFVGLGAPYWKPEARAFIGGMNFETSTAHIARAALEGIAFRQADVLTLMTKEARRKLKFLKVNGMVAASNLLLQFQSDISGLEIVRPQALETAVVGAAFLAGLGIDFWKDLEDLEIAWKEERRFRPQMDKKEVKERLACWQEAVKKA